MKKLTPFYKSVCLMVILLMAWQFGRTMGQHEKSGEVYLPYTYQLNIEAQFPEEEKEKIEIATSDIYANTPLMEEIKIPEEPKEIINPAPTADPPPRKEYKGVFEGDTIAANITHYDICRACCGKTDGITASGFKVKNGMDDPYIVACNWLPFDSVIAIDGMEYTVKDRGGKGLNDVGMVDIFTPSGHAAALDRGRIHTELVIVSIGGE